MPTALRVGVLRLLRLEPGHELLVLPLPLDLLLVEVPVAIESEDGRLHDA